MTVALQQQRRRVFAAWMLPASITACWAIWIATHSHWDRVAGHWEAAVTMVFGSFVAGATPQGGGAVAFPVFTKVLGVSAPVARTFSLSIQAIGMTTAALIILITRRTVSWRAVGIGAASGMVGFLFALFVLSDPDQLVWSSYIPGPYIKVTFTLVLAAMSWIVMLSIWKRQQSLPTIARTPRVMTGLVVAGLVGGIASALTGSGVDVAVFLFIVVLCGLHTRIAVPTSILAMATISVLGFVILGLLGGQLSVVMTKSETVGSIGGQAVNGLSAGQFDIYGLWLASIPIVVWGAPLGTWVAHILSEGRLIALVALMALTEVVSTAVFLDELRTDTALLVYATVGLIASIGLITWLATKRPYFVQPTVTT